ncbi:MAG: hypothetical protein QOD30_1884 [Actinomycetota bacterium]|nr:hypothetical protein [Actinomycetota bacterium]
MLPIYLRTPRHHEEVIAGAVKLLENDDLLAWEVGEVATTMRMYAASLSTTLT